jgi:hypothetical protein
MLITEEEQERAIWQTGIRHALEIHLKALVNCCGPKDISISPIERGALPLKVTL